MMFCSCCGEPIGNGNEINYNNFTFCSIKCMDKHLLVQCKDGKISFLDLPKKTRDRELSRKSLVTHQRTCPICGVAFYVHLGREFNNKYCSDECRRIACKRNADRLSIYHTGWLSPNWHGGVSNGEYCNKFNADLRRRVRAYFDDTCFLCGKSKEENGKRLAVHHVNYNKNACCDSSKVLMVPLCMECHGKTNHDREYYESYFEDILREQYDYKCYYTKEEYNEFKSQVC